MDSNPERGSHPTRSATGENGAPSTGPVGRLPVERYLSAIVAHELGNPFTALIGRLEMLEMRKGLPDTARRDLEAMRQAGDRMSRILENLKAFSRGNSVRTGDVPLAGVMERATQRFRVLLPDVALSVSLPPAHLKVHADASLLEETLVSTLQTLAERRGGVHEMTVSWGQDREVEELSITIRDDGRSFNEDEILRVFHPFSSGDLGGSKSLVALSYGYYVIRAWGGTYRFPRANTPVTELCLVAAS